LDRVQPSLDKFGPVCDWEIRKAESPTVSTVRVDMKLGGDLGVLEREEVDSGVFDVDGIVFGLNDEGGRSFLCGMDISVGREVLFGEGEVAGVDDDGEVGAAAFVVGGIDDWVEALIEVRAERGGEMRSGGETKDADAMRVDVPFGGVRPDEADGALRVLQSGGRFRVWTGVGDAIFEKDTGDAAAREPVADFGAFEIDRENVITATRKDHNSCASAFCGGLVESDRGIRDVAETDQRFAGDEIVFGSRGVAFGLGVWLCVGHALGPDGNLSVVGRGGPA